MKTETELTSVTVSVHSKQKLGKHYRNFVKICSVALCGGILKKPDKRKQKAKANMMEQGSGQEDFALQAPVPVNEQWAAHHAGIGRHNWSLVSGRTPLMFYSCSHLPLPLVFDARAGRRCSPLCGATG